MTPSHVFICFIIVLILPYSSKQYITGDVLDCGTEANVYWGFYNPHVHSINDTEEEATPTICRNICDNTHCDSWLIDPGDSHTCHFYIFMDGPYIYSCSPLNDPPTQAGQWYGEIKVCTGNTWDANANKTIWNVAHDSGVGLSYVYNNHNCIILSSGDGTTNNLSGGTIFVIIFGSCFALYCIIGYVIGGFKKKEWLDVKANIPHYTFWDTLPKWTATGCRISFDYVRSLTSKS